MEYSVNKLSKLAGVSARTLRYYDQIGLLKPAKIAESGYRIYEKDQADTLQQILYFRELGFELSQIKDAIYSKEYDPAESLTRHLAAMEQKRRDLDRMIKSIELAIRYYKGEINMSDNAKFEAFKAEKIKENEEKYGKEIREKYGEKTVEASNQKFAGLSKEDYERAEALAREILTKLAQAVKTGDPASDIAQEVCALHKEWLQFYWPSYSKEAHAGLGEMYVADERFKKYYDDEVPSGAEFLRDSLNIFCK